MVVLGTFLLIGFLFFGMISGVLLGSSGMDVQIKPAWLAYPDHAFDGHCYRRQRPGVADEESQG